MAKMKLFTDDEILTAEDVNDILNPDVPSGVTTRNADLSSGVVWGSGFSGTVTVLRRRDWIFLDVNTLTRASGSGAVTAFTIPAEACPPVEVHPLLYRTDTGAGVNAWLAAAGQLRSNFPLSVSLRGFITYPAPL